VWAGRKAFISQDGIGSGSEHVSNDFALIVAQNSLDCDMILFDLVV
jgi:hypothetical protein